MNLNTLLAAATMAGTLVISNAAFAGSGIVGFSCKPQQPSGCYVTTHPDRVTKSVFFYNDLRNNCGARIKNCKDGKCSSISVQLTASPDWSAWNASKKYTAVNQLYKFTFSGKLLGGGLREDMTFNIRNLDPKTGKQKNTINSYFKGSTDGC